ncbi:G-protein coupled receptor 6-like [Branchiostoma floridae x Branchiostoma belcheri]
MSLLKPIVSALLMFIHAILYAGVLSASVPGLSVTKQQVGDNTSISSNSTSRNVSSKICDPSSATNNSEIAEKNTFNVTECLSIVVTDLSSTNEEEGSAGIMVYLSACVGIWAVVANSLPLAAIIKQEHLQTPAYILMANLAASDVLTGFSSLLSAGTRVYFVQTATSPSEALLRFRFTVLLLSGMSSAYGLMALTAERYWFIVHGMTYVNNVTNDKCKLVAVLVWAWSLLLAILPTFDWYCEGRFDERCIPLGAGLSFNYVVVILVFIFIPIAAIIFLNMGILWCLWKQVNAIAAQEAAVGAQPSTSRKSAFTVVLITVVFLVGWLPLAVRMALFTRYNTPMSTVLVFVALNSSSNPVIYGFRLKEVRRGVVRLFTNH